MYMSLLTSPATLLSVTTTIAGTTSDNMAQPLKLEKLSMIGCGSMGSGMAQLFAENGYEVGLQDPSSDAMDKVIKEAKESNIGDKIKRFDDYSSLSKWLGSPQVFVWSLPQ